MINWDLITRLRSTPHLLLGGPHDTSLEGVGEVLQEARAAHHLLDMAGISSVHGKRQPDASDLDARTYQLVIEMGALKDRLARIASWHGREAGEGGTVGDFCIACGMVWPCDTRRMADGTYDDLSDACALGVVTEE